GPKFTQKREKRAEKKERERGRQKQTDHSYVFTSPALEIVLNDKKLNPCQICRLALADRYERVVNRSIFGDRFDKSRCIFRWNNYHGSGIYSWIDQNVPQERLAT
ncbi:MAG: hypothetical protein OIF58_14210, partial [Cohaesibacter sp.]|nr:hypothetical protein [Cohaesibacter sp.]